MKGSTLLVSLLPSWQCQRPSTAHTEVDFLSSRERGLPENPHNQHVASLYQAAVSLHLTERQISNKRSKMPTWPSLTKCDPWQTKDDVYYSITDFTKILWVPMKKLLSHTQTKMELATYLTDKVMTNFSRQGRRQVVVAQGSKCKAEHKDVRNLQSNQEVANKKTIFHAADATLEGTMEFQVQSWHWCLCSCFKIISRALC